MNKKILINASNLHTGGGVQVATSTIDEISKILKETQGYKDLDISVFASKKVYNNLTELKFDKSPFANFHVFDLVGIKSIISEHKKKFNGYDVCFSIFGPMYFDISCKKHIVGFAQPWIAYPNNPVFRQLSLNGKLQTRLKYFIQWHQFTKSSALVVELEHVREALAQRNQFQKKDIFVVENCFSSIFLDKEKWMNLNFESSKINSVSRRTLGFIGRGYPHKNLSILGKVSDILTSKYSFQANFLFTLTNQELEDLNLSNRTNFVTTGPISAAQCPVFFNKVDALIFPSLLECFSATPLESMVMKTPVFASDLPFVRDACKDHAIYFDPLNPEDIADAIYKGFSTPKELEALANKAYQHVLTLPSAKDRAIKYLNLIDDFAKKLV